MFKVLYIFTVLPMAICRWVENDDLYVPFVAVFITNIPFSLSGQYLEYDTGYVVNLTLFRRVDRLLVLFCGESTSKARRITYFCCPPEGNEGVYMIIMTKPLSVLIRSQFSVAETGVEPFVFPAPTPPKPQMMQTPVDALTRPNTGRSRLTTYSLGMARTRPPSPTSPSATRVPPTPRRSRSAESLPTTSRGLGLKYKAKWQGGNLQLSHSNLRPKE